MESVAPDAMHSRVATPGNSKSRNEEAPRMQITFENRPISSNLHLHFLEITQEY